MRIGYLGFGAWGCCLASLLAQQGHLVSAWSHNAQLVAHFRHHRRHPRLSHPLPEGLTVTDRLEEAIADAELLVESVTCGGLRTTLQRLRGYLLKPIPFVLTSKGIEQDSCLTLPEVVIETLGEPMRQHIALLSGPSFAEEVMRGLPTSVVASAYDSLLIGQVCRLFTTKSFRVYPNQDLRGVAYGGAMKNVIAIACGFAEGLLLGYGCSATLMTRGLHEMAKLAIASGSRPETLWGLSGMGDLCMTCSSPMSRNFRFGHLLATGYTFGQALEEIGMVVEGAYTCRSLLQLSEQRSVAMPIAETVYKILYEELQPLRAVELLMQRTIKEEHL